MALFKRKKRNDEGKIYQTTDGFFYDNNIKRNKKKRLVVAVNQRDDGAVTVAKIHSKNGKNEKNYIKGLILKPNDHSSLSTDSVISIRNILGVRRNGLKYPIYPDNLTKTSDELSKREIMIVKKKIGGKNFKERKTYKKTLRKWKKHFENKKNRSSFRSTPGG